MENPDLQIQATEGETIEHVWLTSKGISDQDDARSVEADIDQLQGVREVRVNTSTHEVEVVFDPQVVSLPAIEEVMQRHGYKVDSRRFGAPTDNPAR